MKETILTYIKAAVALVVGYPLVVFFFAAVS